VVLYEILWVRILIYKKISKSLYWNFKHYFIISQTYADLCSQKFVEKEMKIIIMRTPI